jgi:hypothetical protein
MRGGIHEPPEAGGIRIDEHHVSGDLPAQRKIAEIDDSKRRRTDQIQRGGVKIERLGQFGPRSSSRTG